MVVLVFLLGLLVGSFLNVVISRVPEGKSVVHPASACPKCGYQLRPIDNIPILSFLLLNGKCRSCKSRISIQYPIIELLTGVIFGLIYLRTGFTLLLLFDLALVSIFISVVMIDLEHEIIPDPLNLSLGLLGLVYIFVTGQNQWLDATYGFLVGGGFLFLIALAGPMGGGDIKFMAATGLWLGLFPTVLALLLSFILGGVISVLLILFKIKGRKDHIPFGPFLVFGSIIGYFFYSEFLIGYFKLIL